MKAGLFAVLETLNAHYRFDACGRMASTIDGGVPPRFVLCRAEEGCVWRFRSDLPTLIVAKIARLAGREGGAPFDGDLPAPPERLAEIEAQLEGGTRAARRGRASVARRDRITRGGVTVGEIWRID